MAAAAQQVSPMAQSASCAGTPASASATRHSFSGCGGGGGNFADATTRSPTGADATASRRSSGGLIRSRRNSSKTRDSQVPFQDLLDHLGRQKEDFRREQEGDKGPQTPQRFAHSKRRAAADAKAAAANPVVKSSTLHGSAKFSFGKPRHLTGRFGLPVLEPRDMDYVVPTGGVVVPGPGKYNHSHSDGKDLAATEGHTGGWSWRNHNLFLKTLRNEYEETADADFFDRLQFLMPEMPRKSFTDHLRWIADNEVTSRRNHLSMRRFVAEGRGEEAHEETPVERQQRLAMQKRVRAWREQADEEDERSGLRDREIRFRPVQHFDGKDVEGNFRGHPQYKRSPGYCWSASREPKDLWEKRRSGLSHVRSTSALDVPGPGQYSPDQSRIMPRSASHSFYDRLPPQKVDKPTTAGPGYDGPLDAAFKLQDDIRVIQNEQPHFSMGRELRKSKFMPEKGKSLTATDPNVGPGKYEYPECWVSQF